MSSKEAVRDRLDFAERRLDDLRALNGGDLAGAADSDRQQLIQEYFFHLVGAIDFLAQSINVARELDLDHVNVPNVAKQLSDDDPLTKVLNEVHPRWRNALPDDPYSDDASFLRILKLRHHVCHRGHNPFVFRLGSGTRASLVLDPIDSQPSDRPVLEELRRFLDLLRKKCTIAFELL